MAAPVHPHPDAAPVEAPPSDLRTPELPVLDTLRAVGALCVLTTHVAFWAGTYTTAGVAGFLLARLDVGVAIFFVLSGFLLSYPWIARAAVGAASPPAGRYYWRRFLRIYPPYLLTCLISLTLLAGNRGRGPVEWVTTLLLGDIYVHARLPAGLTQMWSLATEVAFYAVLPLLMLLGVGRRLRGPRLLTLLGAMATVSVLWFLVLSGQLPHPGRLPVTEWLPGFLGWFGVGIALATAHVLHRDGRLPGRLSAALFALARQPGACCVLVLGLMLVASTGVAGPVLLAAASGPAALTKNLLYGVVAGLVVTTGVFGEPGSAYQRVLSHPLLRHIGLISYSIFCLHLPILTLVMWLTGYDLFYGHFWQIWGLTLVLTLPAAELTYRAVELPVMRLRNLRLRGGPAADATTPPRPTSTK